MIPDSVFILLGVVPLVAAGVYGLFHLRAENPPASLTVWVPDEQGATAVEEEREVAGVR